MKIYFDSSILVAAMVEEEEHHYAAFEALANAGEGFTSTHALAETFATLTSGRLDIQLAPDDAMRVIQTNIGRHLHMAELTLSDYWQAMKNSQMAGARGGAFYDMLHLQVARRVKAQRIFTINTRHFQVFAPDLADIILLP